MLKRLWNNVVKHLKSSVHLFGGCFLIFLYIRVAIETARPYESC